MTDIGIDGMRSAIAGALVIFYLDKITSQFYFSTSLRTISTQSVFWSVFFFLQSYSCAVWIHPAAGDDTIQMKSG